MPGRAMRGLLRARSECGERVGRPVFDVLNCRCWFCWGCRTVDLGVPAFFVRYAWGKDELQPVSRLATWKRCESPRSDSGEGAVLR